MYIKRLEISNFQRHKILAFDLSPHVNSIMGESETGKSTVIRAIRWAMFNKPDGHQIRKWGTKQTSVAITLDNGIIITRVRSQKVNRYVIEEPNRAPEVYENFGLGVPDPIKAILGVFKAEFSETVMHELTVSRQTDSSFLLSDSGEKKAQVLGKLSKTTLIDNAVRMIGSDVRNRGREMNLIEKSLGQLNERVSEYDGLEEDEKTLGKLEVRANDLNLKDKRIKLAEAIINGLRRIYKQMKFREARLKKLEMLPEVENLETLGMVFDQGVRIATRLRDLDLDIPDHEMEIAAIGALSPEIVEEFEEAGRRVDGAEDFYRRTQDWKKGFVDTTGKLAKANERLKLTVNELLMKVRTQGTCPMCFRDIEDDDIEKISEELMADLK